MGYHYNYTPQEHPFSGDQDPTEIARLEAGQTLTGEGQYALPPALKELYSRGVDHITEPTTAADADYREPERQGGLSEISSAGGSLTSDDPLIRFVRERGPEWGEPTMDSPLGYILGIKFPDHNQ
jgi:hypothetical protein